MDFVSHFLLGILLILTKTIKKEILLLGGLFAVIPDLFQIFLYLILGYEQGRLLFIPFNSDWTGFTALHPKLCLLYFIPHSLTFLILVIVPLIFYFQLPKILIFAYLSHIVLDIFTHTGEWTIKIFWPLNYRINGLTDAWAWPFNYIILVWLFLITFSFFFYLNKQKISKVKKIKNLN